MSNQPIRYAYDRTGRSRDNLVINEVHQLRDVEMRVFAPNSGAFYTESVVVRDVANGQILRVGDQYKFGNYYPEASREANKEVATVIVITDANVSNRVSVDYQVVGGLYGFSNKAIILQIEALQLDRRPAKWKNIFDKPDGFTPSPHTHTMQETFGYQHVITMLAQIRHAILTGDEASHTAIYEYIDSLEARLQGISSSAGNTFSGHINNRNNPHGVTAAQINAYTKNEITNLLNQVKKLINDHTSQSGNVHGLTPAVLGVYDKNEINTKITDLINKLKPVEAHLLRVDNPHRVTAEQINTYTKQVIDQKVSAVQLDLNKLKTSKNTILRMVAGDVGAYTKAETNTEIDRRVNAFKNAITDSRGKLKESPIPISTYHHNQLFWNKDGLYVGPHGQDGLNNLFVDAVSGRDIAHTPTNRAGSKENPFQTIKFAIDQSRADSALNIHLKENQEHVIRVRHDNERIDVRGRQIRFKNYGTQTEGINNDPWHNNIHNFSAKIVFDSAVVVNEYLYTYVFTNDPTRFFDSRIYFEGVRLIRRTSSFDVLSGITLKLSSNTGIFNAWADMDVQYRNVQIDTGPLVRGLDLPFHRASTDNIHRVNLAKVSPSAVTGACKLFHFVDYVNHMVSITGSNWTIAQFDERLYESMRKRDGVGQYVNFFTNMRSNLAGFHVANRVPTSQDIRNMGLEDGFVWFVV